MSRQHDTCLAAKGGQLKGSIGCSVPTRKLNWVKTKENLYRNDAVCVGCWGRRRTCCR